MKRRKESPVPPAGEYRPCGEPLEGVNELADLNEPLPPLMRYATPLLSAETFAMLRQWNPEEAERFLKLNGPSVVG